MRQNDGKKNGGEKRTLLAATLACYLLGFACVFALSYSLVTLATPNLANNMRRTIEAEAGP